MDVDHPPFRVLQGQSAHRAAQDIVSVFESIDGMPDKIQWVHEALSRRIAGADHAILAAGRALSTAIDADGAFIDQVGYHNRQHSCEVMLAAYFLCQLNGLPAIDSQLVVLAALIHDLGHDGTPSRSFRLERHSVERAAPYLSRAGLQSLQLRQLTALVLATEPVEGVRAALSAWEFHQRGCAVLPAPLAALELEALAADAQLARMAIVLCEADLLPSVGLTLAHGLRLQDRLATEWGRPLGLQDKLNFVSAVLGCKVIGKFFKPNARAMKQALVRLVDEQARV